MIDIRNGIAVRAVAGDRAFYKPLESRLTSSVEPAEVLKSLQAEFGCRFCYVADLDGIEHRGLNRCTLAEMARTGVALMVDGGSRTVDDVSQLLDIGVQQVIVSSESLQEIRQLSRLAETIGEDHLIFSVDLKAGQLRIADPDCSGLSSLQLVQAVVESGVRHLIVLDLAAVGTGTGLPTLPLCCEIRRGWPQVRIITGGGVHSTACIQSARQAGIDGLLISSALHDGRLSSENLAAL